MIKFEAARTIFFQWRFRRYRRHCCLSTLIGTLRSNDADGNENVKKKIGLIRKNNNFARALRFFVHFFSCFCTTTTLKCLLLRFMDNVNKQRRNFISLCELRHGPWPWNSASGGFAYIWQVGRNNRYKDWRNANSIFKQRSRCRPSLDLKVPNRWPARAQ